MAAAPPARAADPTIAAAGDIACDPLSSSYHGGAGTATACHAPLIAGLINGDNVSAVLPLGDNQYYCGSLRAFQMSYAASWGQFLAISHPTVGNHEYLTSPAADAHRLHRRQRRRRRLLRVLRRRRRPGRPGVLQLRPRLLAPRLTRLELLNAGGCGITSPQGKWLAADLRADTQPCTLAYWHIPLFSSGGRASSNSRSLYTQLYKFRADVVLTGHDHIYERFAPQSPTGVAGAAGIREFVVGTGGADHTSIAAVASNSLVRNTTTFGVLLLTLHPTGYEWRIQPEPGGTFTDAGSGTCHRSPDLAVTQQAQPRPAQVGGATTFVVTVRNRGASPAAAVRLADLPPAAPAAIGAVTASQGSCTSGRPVTCLLGKLGAGAAATVRIVVHTPRVGRVVNDGTASSTPADVDVANDTSALAIPVVPGHGGCTVAGTAGNDIIIGTATTPTSSAASAATTSSTGSAATTSSTAAPATTISPAGSATTT